MLHLNYKLSIHSIGLSHTIVLQCFGEALPRKLHHAGTRYALLPLLSRNQDLVLGEPFQWVVILLKGRLCPSILHGSVDQPGDTGLGRDDTGHQTQEWYRGGVGHRRDDFNGGCWRNTVRLCKQTTESEA